MEFWGNELNAAVKEDIKKNPRCLNNRIGIVWIISQRFLETFFVRWHYSSGLELGGTISTPIPRWIIVSDIEYYDGVFFFFLQFFSFLLFNTCNWKWAKIMRNETSKRPVYRV